MKKLLIFSILFLLAHYMFSQKNNTTCGTSKIHLEQMKNSSTYLQKVNNNNQKWVNYVNNAAQKNSAVFRPTVLNIMIHDVSTTNVFNGTNVAFYQNLVTDINTVFSSIADMDDPVSNPVIDTEIQFCLAQQKTNGDTVGLADIQKANYANSNEFHAGLRNELVTSIQADTDFPTDEYVNLYIVDDITEPDGTPNNIAGFSSYPSAHGNIVDGIFIQRGTLQNPTALNTYIHELGHYLGLRHTFGTCDIDYLDEQCFCDNTAPLTQGDYIEDTPPSKPYANSANLGNENFCSNTIIQQTVCNGYNATQTELNAIQFNYMNYFNNNCRSLFSHDQITEMQFTLDDAVGSRRSLLDTNACVDCSDLDGCIFTINNSIGTTQMNFDATPTFDVNATDCTNNSILTYQWQLTNVLDNITTNNNTTSFTPQNLEAGLYNLTLSVSSGTNCIEEVQYNFYINPEDTTDQTCLVEFTDWSNLQRVSFVDGWTINNSGTRTVHNATDTSEDFDIFQANTFSDPNLANPPAELDGTNIIRVGRQTTSTLPNGAASYVSLTFTPTLENSKFRVYFTGMVENWNSNSFSIYPHLIFSNNNYPNTFGWFCNYNLSNPIRPINQLGAIEEGTLSNTNHDYEVNDFILGNSSFEYPSGFGLDNFPSDQVIVSGETYNRLTGWNAIDLDFSQFIDGPGTIDDNLNSTITITFFARSGAGADNSANAYAYFGIKCLPSNLPDYIPNLEVDDMVIPCGQTCVEQYINPDNFGELNSAIIAASLTEYNPTDDSFGPVTSSHVNISTPPPFSYIIKICDQTAPSVLYQLTINTLHQTITDTFLVTTNVNTTTLNLCDPTSTNTNQGGDIPLNIDQVQEACTGDLLTLTFSEPCTTVLEYRWKFYYNSSYSENYISPIVNPTANSSTLQITAPNICEVTYIREARVIDPNCGTPVWIKSDRYTILNSNAYSLDVEYTSISNNICIGEDIEISGLATLNICDDIDIDTTGPNQAYTLTFQIGDVIIEEEITNSFPNGANTTSIPFNLTISLDEIYDNNLVETDALGIMVSATSFFNNCTNNNVIIYKTYNTFSNIINVAPIPIGGEIALDSNCNYSNINITSLNHGLTGNDYTWEYSTSSDFSTNVNTIPGETGSTITGLNLSNITTDSSIYIRRVSHPFNNSGGCEGNLIAYSDSVEILENTPECFDITQEIIDSIQPSEEECYTYTFEMPIEYFDCYSFNIKIKIFLPRGNSTIIYPNTVPGLNSFSIPENCSGFQFYINVNDILDDKLLCQNKTPGLTNHPCTDPCEDFQEPITLSSVNNDDNTNTTGTPINYLYYKSIIASNIIEANASSTFSAENFIKLKPGFHAKHKSYFHAYLENCNVIIDTSNQKNHKASSEKKTAIGSYLKVHPNPATSKLNITLSNGKINSYELRNIHGQLVKTVKDIQSSSHQLDVSDLASGMYLLKVTFSDNTSVIKKIIIQ